MKRLAGFVVIFASIVATGCGDAKPVNVADGASDEQIAEYNRMRKESEDRMKSMSLGAEAAETEDSE